jgi:AcrR family transcriptional regulator
MAKQSNSATQIMDVREKILSTATDLFYKQGIRAVGVDLVVEKAGVAKTSLYRHFPTKDDLVVAFLQVMDKEFWKCWDEVTVKHPEDARAELYGQLDWIGERSGQKEYRGCPQINIAAEFPELDHPARKIAKEHKLELRRRLKAIAERLNGSNPDELAGQLAMLINGAFVSTPMYFDDNEAKELLWHTVDALLVASGVKK